MEELLGRLMVIEDELMEIGFNIHERRSIDNRGAIHYLVSLEGKPFDIGVMLGAEYLDGLKVEEDLDTDLLIELVYKNKKETQ